MKLGNNLKEVSRFLIAKRNTDLNFQLKNTNSTMTQKHLYLNACEKMKERIELKREITLWKSSGATPGR